MPEMHALTLRLDQELAEQLAIVAALDGEPVAEAIRAAVAVWVARRKQDPRFQEALQRRIAQHRQLLATPDPGSSPGTGTEDPDGS